jgi:hypothetical protein
MAFVVKTIFSRITAETDSREKAELHHTSYNNQQRNQLDTIGVWTSDGLG